MEARRIVQGLSIFPTQGKMIAKAAPMAAFVVLECTKSVVLAERLE